MLLARVSTTVVRTTKTLVAPTATRALAIKATVKTAPDTSGMNFPAPSHVSVTGMAADITSQLTEFYQNPDSVIELTPEARAELQDTIAKRIAAIPDSNLPESHASTLDIPENIRIGDNPLFGIGSK